jgi:hypothetical protein
VKPVDPRPGTAGKMGSLEGEVNRTAWEERKIRVVVEFGARSSARNFELGRPGPGCGYSLDGVC